MNVESISFRNVLLVSGTIGFLIGSVLVSTWQDAVESGQVIAGVVEYPHANPHYQYHIQLWTIVCQISGLSLALGMSEYVASILLSGIVGALMFVSLATTTWALCRNGFLAIVSPCLAFAAYQAADQYGVAYPVYAMGNRATHGMMAQVTAVLVLGLAGSERYRSAAFLAGLIPAIHPIIGAWCWGILFLGCALRPSFAREHFRSLPRWFAAGFSVVLVSFGVMQWMSRHVPNVPADVQRHYRSAYMENWDFHRQAVSFDSPGLFIVIGVGFVCALLWQRRAKEWPESTVYLLACLSAASLTGIVLCALTLVGDALPPIVNALMPGRFVNPVILIAPAVIVGIAGLHSARPWAQVLLVLHVAFITWSRVFPGEHVVFRFDVHWIELLTVIALVVCGITGLFDRFDKRIESKVVYALISLLTLCALGASTGRLYRKGVQPPMDGRHNDAVMLAVSPGDGLLATASNIGQIQIGARRPVLLNGAAIDFLPYMPAAGPEMNEILINLYGVDLLGDPPPPDPDYARYLEETFGPEYMSMREEIPELNPGQLPGETGRALWESWSLDQWKAVSSELGFSQVLAFSSWEIRLPEVARNSDYTLYDIPPSAQ